MSILSELESLSGIRILAYSLLAVGSFCPGILFLFIFQRQLFMQLDTVKLFSLALALALPFVVFNALCVGLSAPNKIRSEKESAEHVLTLFTFGAFFTLALFSLAVLAGVFFRLSASRGAVLIVDFQFLLLLFYWVMHRKSLAKKQTEKGAA